MTINKNHSYVTDDGRKFYTAQVVDGYSNQTYDQTVIFEEFEDDVPRIVDYYYGEPDAATTKEYVDSWIAAGN